MAAIKAPFLHNNDDYDELVFYHDGNFFSRDNIHPGMVSLHPASSRMGRIPRRCSGCTTCPANEYAVIIVAPDALEIGPAAKSVELQSYAESWRTSESIEAPRPLKVSR
jgi:homogentisate 1,2-dioxygenase